MFLTLSLHIEFALHQAAQLCFSKIFIAAPFQVTVLGTRYCGIANVKICLKLAQATYAALRTTYF